jgi:hypothetical protein
MKSRWVEHKGKRILYQDFSGFFYNSAGVKEELGQVEEVVRSQPRNSVLILTSFQNTQVGADLMPALNAASTRTKDHVLKTAVIGVGGIKRTLGDLLSRLTGQQLKYFQFEEEAKNWLVQD